MRAQHVLSLDYVLVITLFILIVSTLGNPRPNYFDRNENPELSQWAEKHQNEVNEMANRLRTEYNRAIKQQSGQDTSGGTYSACKTTCIPSTTWVSNTGKTQDEINQIAKEMTLKLVNDLNSGKIGYHQIIQPNWFENYAAHELHLLQNQHYQNNFGAQIHIPQGTYYHKTEKKQVFEYTQEGGNGQPAFIYKPSVTTYEEKKQETQEHSSSGYPTVYYGHGQTVEKIENMQEHKDIKTIAHVPVYTDSYFHSSDHKERNVNRQPTAAPAIHVSYNHDNHQRKNTFAQNVHNMYPTSVPVVSHKEQHIATVEKQTIPIIYKYGNNEHRTEQTHRNRTATYRRPSTVSTNSGTTSRKNITTAHVETRTRRPLSVYSEKKHGIYKHLKIDDGNVPNYKPRVVYNESKVSDYHGFGEEAIASETIESHQNHTKSGHTQINYRPAYVGHQSRYNRTHGYNYTRPGYVIPGGTAQTSHTSQSTQTSQQARPGYAVIGGEQISQTSQSTKTSQQNARPGYVVTGGGSQSQTVQSQHSSQQTHQNRPGYVIVGGGGNSQAVQVTKNIIETVQHTKPNYVLIGGTGQTSQISESSQSAQQIGIPGYVVTGGGFQGGGSKVIQTSYTNHTTQKTRPGYIVVPGAHSNQISQTSQTSEQIVRPGYVITQGGGSQTSQTSQTSQNSHQITRPGYVIAGGGGGSQTVETSHSSQTTQQGGRPGFVVVGGGGGSQTLESTYTNHTSQQGTRPGYLVTGGGGQTTLMTHSSQTSEQSGRPGYMVVTGGGSQTIDSSHTSESSHEIVQPEFIITGVGNSQTVETTHSSETLEQGRRPGYVVVTGGGGTQFVNSSHTIQTTQQGTRPGFVITGGGGQTVETSNFNQSSQQNSRPGYIITGGGGQTIESTHYNQTSQQGSRPGYIITPGGGSQTVETSHSSQITQQGGRPGLVVVGVGGGSQTVESTYTNHTSQQGTRPGYVVTGGGGQTTHITHSSQTSEQSGRPGYVVVTGGGSQTIDSSHTSESSHEVMQPNFVITGVSNSKIVETTHTSETLQQGGRPGYVVVGGGGETQTVDSSHTSQTTQNSTRPVYVITGGNKQTSETLHVNQTSQHTRPGYIIAGGGSSHTDQSINSSQTSQHTHPGYIITGGGSQSVEITHTNQSSQQTARPGYIITGGGSQTIESTQTNQASQNSRPGYVVIGSGGQTSEIYQTNQSSQGISRPGYIVTGGGSQTVESTHTSETSEQSSRPGYVITGEGGSQTEQTSQSNHSEKETRPGYVVIGGGGQSSQISHANQTSEQTSRPGYIITGGGSQTIETSQTNENSQENRPGYVLVGGSVSQTSQTSQSNQSSVHGNNGFVVIGGGNSQNYSQQFISQLNHTGGGLHITDGSYISGVGFQEVKANWTSGHNKKPLLIISKNRGDQPPHQFEDYYDSEEILEKEPGIGFYPTGIKPEIGLLVPGRAPITNQHGQSNIHRSHGIHSSHSQSSHHNHQTHVHPGSAVTTTHKHQTHTIGTLPRGSRPLLEDHHVDKQLVGGSSHNIHSSQSNIRDNELREEHYGFNKSKHHHKSNEHIHSGISNGQHQHRHSSQHHSGSQQHRHRHHHGDRQTSKTEFYSIIRDGRRQNVSREEYEEMLKSEVKLLIEKFTRTIERDIQNIDPEEDKEAMELGIVYDQMEQFLLQINKVTGDDPDTKKIMEPLISKEIENFQKKHRVKRSFLNLASQTTKATGHSQLTPNNTGIHIDANLESELFNTGILPGTVEQLPRLGLGANINTYSYSARGNANNPNDVTHNTLDTQTSYDLTQQTQTEDLSQFSLGFTNQPAKSAGLFTPNPDSVQKHLEEDFSMYSLNNIPESTNIYSGTEYDDQQTLNEDLTQFLGNNQYSENLDTQKHITLALPPKFPTHSTNTINQHTFFPTYQPIGDIIPKHPTSSFIQPDNNTGDTKFPGTCCWHAGSPNYQPIGNDIDKTNIIVGPVAEKPNFKPNNPIYEPIVKPFSTNPVTPIYNSIVVPSTPSAIYNSSDKLKEPASSKVSLDFIRYPGTCCWQRGSPNYQPIGSKINITDISVGPVSQKQEIPVLPIYEVINNKPNIPPQNFVVTTQNTSKHIYISINTPSPLIVSENKTSGNIENARDELAVSQGMSGPKRCCWQAGGPNYNPIDTTTDITNVETIVNPIGYVSTPPCRNESAIPINPSYIPIDVLPLPIGQDKPIESTKPTKLIDYITTAITDHPETQPNYPDEQFTVDNLQSTYPEEQFTVGMVETNTTRYPAVQIYKPFNIPKLPTIEAANQPTDSLSKPVIKPVYATEIQSQASYSDEKYPINILQPSRPRYPEIQIYDPYNIPKQPTIGPTDQPKVLQTIQEIRPVYPFGTTQPIHPDEQFTVDILQSSYPGYSGSETSDSHFNPKQPTVEPIGYPGMHIHDLHNIPKQSTIGPTGKPVEIPSKPAVGEVSSYGAIHPTYVYGQSTVDILQPSYPENTGEPVYEQHYIPNQPPQGPMGKPEVIPSKPVVEPIYPHTTSSQHLPISVLQPGYLGEPIYDSHYTPKQPTVEPTSQPDIPSKPAIRPLYSTETQSHAAQPNGKFPINVLQPSGLHHPGIQIYDPHNTPKPPTIGTVGQPGLIPPKQAVGQIYQSGAIQSTYTDGQFTVDNLQPNYPGRPIFEQHYIPKQPSEAQPEKPEIIESKPVIGPIYPPNTPQQLPINIPYPGGPIINLHYTPKQPTIRPTGQPEVDQSISIIGPIYPFGTTQPTHPDEQFTVDVLQSSYPERSIYDSHYNPKQFTVIASKPEFGSTYLPAIPSQPPHRDGQITIDFQQSSGLGYPGEIIYGQQDIGQLYPSGTLQPTDTDRQFTVDISQPRYPEYQEVPIYDQYYNLKQPIEGQIVQPDVIPSKPIAGPIYKPDTSLQQLPINVVHPSRTEYPGIYGPHLTPNKPIVTQTSQTEVIASKPAAAPAYPPGTSQPTHLDKQFTVDILQPTYPENPEFPIYDSHYISRNQEGHILTGQVMPSKPAVWPLYPSGTIQPTDSNGQFTVNIYDSHYTPKQTIIAPTEQPEMILSKPVKPDYQPVTPLQNYPAGQGPINNIKPNYSGSSGSSYPDGQPSETTKPSQTYLPISSDNSGQNISKTHTALPRRPTYNYPPYVIQYGETKVRPGDISYMPVGHVFYPNTIIRPAYNSNTTDPNFEPWSTIKQDQINQVSDQKLNPQSSSPTYNYQSHNNQYGVVNVRPGNITYMPVRHVFYPHRTVSNPNNLQIQSTDTLSQQNIHYRSTIQESRNTPIISTSEHRQIQDQRQKNQYTNQITQTYNLSTVQQNIQHTKEPVNVLYENSELNQNHSKAMHKEVTLNQYDDQKLKLNVQPFTYSIGDKPIVPLSGHTNNVTQFTQQTTQQFSQKPILPVSEYTNTSQHYLSEKSGKNATNTQQITHNLTQSHTDHRRGDQTSFDDVDYGDGSYETNILKIANAEDLNQEMPQKTLLLSHLYDDYFQYTDRDAELQQLTQKITKEDFTSFVKSPQRSKRQIIPSSALGYVTQKSSNNNANSLVSDENDESISQAKEQAVIDYQNHPRNLNHL